jgi:Reverse transcriptase (RNA-dependent DNA polymerase)
LERLMYGLVQAAQQFFLKYSKILKKIGFIQSIAEPCLFCKKVEDGSTVLMVIHVDDCYVIGKIEAIDLVVKDIQAEGLKLKVAHNTKD